MKKYCILFLLPFLVSCSNWLELIPLDGLVKDEYWKTKEDVEATLMGAYQLFARQDADLFMYGEIRGDMLKIGDNLSVDRQSIMEGNISSSNELTDWQNFYTVINYCNSVLKYAPIIRETDVTYSEYQMKGHESEALYLRSLAYFYLVRIFHDVPLVIKSTESDNDELFPPKSTELQILDQIEADLKLARLGVTGDYGSEAQNKGRANKAAINALLADIALWNFKYEDCIQYVEEIEKDGYVVIPGSRWFEIFNPGNSVESIFEFQFNQSLGQSNSIYNLTYFYNYFPASEIAIQLLEPILIRGNGSIQVQNKKIWKYAGVYADGLTSRSGSDNQSANWIVYRMADVKLMKAEALSQLERYTEALDVINNFRINRLQSPLESPGFSAEAFEDIILKERAIELAFEGKRWFDLLRMGRRNNFQRKQKLIEVLVQNVPASQKLILSAKLTNPMGWYLPIQADELNRNSNLIQNPYYAVYTNN